MDESGGVFSGSPNSAGQVVAAFTLTGGGAFESFTFVVDPSSPFLTFEPFSLYQNGVPFPCQDVLSGTKRIVGCSLAGVADPQNTYELRTDLGRIGPADTITTTATEVKVPPGGCPAKVDEQPYVVTAP
jgi:hypothetical protein